MIHTVVSLCSPLFATGALWIGKWGGKVREGAEERLESRMNTHWMAKNIHVLYDLCACNSLKKNAGCPKNV